MALGNTTQFPPNNSKKNQYICESSTPARGTNQVFRRARPLRKTTRINGLERNGLKRSGRGWNAPGADVLARHDPLLPGRADAIGRGRLIVATWPKSAAKQRQNVPPARSRTRWRSMSSRHRSGPQKRGRDNGHRATQRSGGRPRFLERGSRCGRRRSEPVGAREIPVGWARRTSPAQSPTRHTGGLADNGSEFEARPAQNVLDDGAVRWLTCPQAPRDACPKPNA